MSENDAIDIRLMTYNIGGVKESRFSTQQLMEVITEIQPDILAVQEITERVDFDGNWIRFPLMINDALGYSENFFFGSTISMNDYFHPKKTLFVDGLFSDWQEWQQGNAIFSRWPFIRLGNRSKLGPPRNLPIYRPAIYEGSRDTDPRYIILARIGHPNTQPYIIATHLTTILGEHDLEDPKDLPNCARAQRMRLEQIQMVLEIVNQLFEAGELVILMGDLNAISSEPCISNLLEKEAKFIRLAPTREIPTHPKVREPIDHILVHPGARRIEYTCWTYNDPPAHKASDHLPVVADIKIYEHSSSRLEEFGPGVFNTMEA